MLFVAVRSNLHREMGFLKDMRRMNWAITRAKAGMIVIGDQLMLTENKDEEACCMSCLGPTVSEYMG